MANFYNEIDRYAAEWLRNLIRKGLIPDGEVSTVSIVDLRPSDLSGFTQCHFFSGIGGWSQALHLAGWAPNRPVWTGSCPCQPFSVAGKGAGTNDPRHLWPHFYRLIKACRPPVVLGEQVAGKAGYGWFDGVRADLEGIGYSSRAVDIPALAVGAPHIRQRLYWGAVDELAYANNEGLERAERYWPPREEGKPVGHSSERDSSDMADADQGGRGRRPRDGDGERDGQAGEWHEDHGVVAGGGEDCFDVADTKCSGPQRGISRPREGESQTGQRSSAEHSGSHSRGKTISFWSDHIWLTGSDGKARRSKPGLPLLVNGVPLRVGRLRAYGNAVVPQLAAEVVKALMETLDV